MSTKSRFQIFPPVVAAILLIIGTFAAYFPSLGGQFIWDDDRHVSQNRMLRNLDGLRKIWLRPAVTPQYYPMTHTSFWIEYRFWKLNPTGYHITNVLIHSINALLLWRLLARLEVPGALMAAAIFALHPIQVESVAWISERKNVLAMMFMLLSILVYLRPAAINYFASLVLFFCALTSKTVACSMPAVMILLLWWKQNLTRTEILKLIPFFVIGTVMGLVTAVTERNYVGALGPDWDLSFAARCIIASRAVWFYLGKLVFPVHLTFSYPRWEIHARQVWEYSAVAAIVLALAVLLLNRKRIGTGPITAFLIYLVTLFPALGFFNTYPMRYSFVADHFQYISSAAMITGINALFARVFSQWRLVIGSAVLVTLGAMTIHQARNYQDAQNIWRDTIQKNPDSWMAKHNLAVGLSQLSDQDLRAGRDDAARLKLLEALDLLDQVERLRPQHEKLALNRAEVLQKLGRLEEALAIYDSASRSQPKNAAIVNQIGIVLDALGRKEESIQKFQRAAQIDPGMIEAHVNLARALEARQRLVEAIAAYEQALRVAPNDPRARLELADLLYRPEVNRLPEAAEHLELFLKSHPDDADVHATLGFIYGELARYDEARRHFRAALMIDPNQSKAERGLQLLREK